MTRRCDDDGDIGAPIVGVGQAHGVSGDSDDEPAGRLLVPDPDARHGWREHVVYRPSPQRRRIGFARPPAVRRGR